MSFWKSLFGGGSSESEARRARRSSTTASPSARRPTRPRGNIRPPGSITKDVGGVAKEHKFIRADRHASYDDAVEFSLAKARQIVDQQGERMFS